MKESSWKKKEFCQEKKFRHKIYKKNRQKIKRKQQISDPSPRKVEGLHRTDHR